MNNKNSKWQIFKKTGGKFRNVAISINKNGGIGLLAGFWHQYQLAKKTHVILYFNENIKSNIKSVGFQFTRNAKLPGAYKLTQNRSSASVSPNAFWAAHRIVNPGKYAGAYKPQIDEDTNYGRIFYISLIKKANE